MFQQVLKRRDQAIDSTAPIHAHDKIFVRNAKVAMVVEDTLCKRVHQMYPVRVGSKVRRHSVGTRRVRQDDWKAARQNGIDESLLRWFITAQTRTKNRVSVHLLHILFPLQRSALAERGDYHRTSN